MALVIVTTPSSADANSYVSLADAETIMESVYYKDNWEAATDGNKNIVLVQSTRMIDEQMNFYGSRTFPETQALEFPRYTCPKRTGTNGYISYWDENEIPEWLELATTVYANSLLGENRGADSDTKGFKYLKVDVLAMEVDKLDRQATMSDEVWDIVKFYGTKSDKSSNFIKRV